MCIRDRPVTVLSRCQRFDLMRISYEEMLNLTIEKVFEEGLHEFLVRYLKNLFILATIIETDFRFYR